MTLLFFAPITAIAALYLLFRELIPALRAKVSGRIQTKGHRPRLVERAVEPERFATLVRQRMQLGLAGVGAAVLTGGLLIAKGLMREY